MGRSAAVALVVALASAATAGCGGKSHGCGSAAGTFPADATVIQWDNGTAAASIRGKHYTITVGNQTLQLDTEPMFEAVRFDLTAPATIYGFQVVWNNLAAVKADGSKELAAGIYPDFGYNGFDFWHFQPDWSGTRCVGDLAADGTVDYVLPKPMRVEQPGLIYVAHDAPTPGDPTFAFDNDYVHDPNGQCAAFTDCHSALDLDQAALNQFFNGVSFSFPYDYNVRLYVKYDAAVPPAQKIFSKTTALPPLGVNMALGDYDNDGFDDLLTTTTPGDLYDGLDSTRLFHNNGDGTWTDVSASSGVGAFHGSGAFGDYDNDGYLDIYLASWSYTVPKTLLHNNGNGTFTDVTTAASAGGADLSGMVFQDPCSVPVPYEKAQAGAWVDLDGDGFLDLYLANYNCLVNEPDFEDLVFHNRGDGTFEDWTGTHGFFQRGSASRGANPLDVDQDGDMDVLVHDYVLERNLFFDNNGNGTFRENAKGNGLEGNQSYYNGLAYYGHTLGTAWGDLDGDGDWDLVEANLAHPRFYSFSNKTRVLIQTTGSFADISGDWSFPASAAGLRYQETHTVPTLADVDGDGKLDLFLSSRYDGRPTDFYRGNGDGTFALDMTHSGVDTLNGWCMAAADVDHDGALDLATVDGLFHNQTAAAGNHWLQVRPVGGILSNRSAIGATVTVHAGGKVFLRYVEGSTGQGCQDSMFLSFGLGSIASVDSIDVMFPGAGTKHYAGPFATNQRLWVYENGTVTPGWNAPW